MLDELRKIEEKIDLVVKEPPEELNSINKDFEESEEMEFIDVSRPMPPPIIKEETNTIEETVIEESVIDKIVRDEIALEESVLKEVREELLAQASPKIEVE